MAKAKVNQGIVTFYTKNLQKINGLLGVALISCDFPPMFSDSVSFLLENFELVD